MRRRFEMEATLILIENDADLKKAQNLVVALMDSDDPIERARMRSQVQLVKAYEARHYRLPTASSADVIQYIMEQFDLTPADMAPILGTRSRVSEVINGKRPLSLSMIKRLRSTFHVSADSLIPA
jgi:HTH-type transcriptional regulator/antitoxin HigA